MNRSKLTVDDSELTGDSVSSPSNRRNATAKLTSSSKVIRKKIGSFGLMSKSQFDSVFKDLDIDNKEEREDLVGEDKQSISPSNNQDENDRDNDDPKSPLKLKHARKKTLSLSNFVLSATKTKKKGAEGDEKGIDLDAPENIGLKISLPEALDIMTGKEPIPSPHSPRKLVSNKFTSDTLSGMESPSPRPLTNSIFQFMLRTSKLDPSVHQTRIPPAEQFLFHAKLCNVMEEYNQLIAHHDSSFQLFDFNMLSGMSHEEISSLYRRIMGEKVGGPPATPRSPTKKKPKKVLGTTEPSVQENTPNPEILKMLLDCSDDLVVEGRFCGGKWFDVDRPEVTVFSSYRHRQFIVCFRGSMRQQLKPASLKPEKQKKIESTHLHSDLSDVHVNKYMADAYQTGDMEEKVFDLLNQLSERDPFCDVVMCGHSFGGALACLSAVRFATRYPIMTVSCHAFGSPKVGEKSFQDWADTLPNLKIMRLEHGSDPFVKTPDDTKWTNVGHSIVFVEEQSTAEGAPLSSETVCSPKSGETAKSAITVHAYKFDDRKPFKPISWSGANGLNAQKMKKMKKDHELCSYINCLELFTKKSSDLQWVSHYVGQEGKGISGLDNEERCIV